MKLAFSVALAVALTGAFTVQPAAARAEETTTEGPPVASALLTGAGVAVAGFAVGTALASSSDERQVRNAGLTIGMAGFAVGPYVAHAIAGEPVRGIFAAAIPAAGTVATAVFLNNTPDVMERARTSDQRVFLLLVTGCVIGSAIGFLDVLGAPGRRVVVAPMASPQTAGISVGGVL